LDGLLKSAAILAKRESSPDPAIGTVRSKYDRLYRPFDRSNRIRLWLCPDKVAGYFRLWFWRSVSQNNCCDSSHVRLGKRTTLLSQIRLTDVGDNRDDSFDSRFWGFADENDVEGRASVIYFSWDHDGHGVLPFRWNRFGKVLD
jgi:hypothetical protein